MNIINTILNSAQEAAISHYRVLLLLSAIWFMLASFTRREKHLAVYYAYIVAGTLFAVLSIYYFIIAIKSMRFFARVGAIAGMISIILLLSLSVMVEFSRRYFARNHGSGSAGHGQIEDSCVDNGKRKRNGKDRAYEKR